MAVGRTIPRREAGRHMVIGLLKIALVLFIAYQIHQMIWVDPFRPD
ncbi:hypothetical protein [Mycobacterium sp. CnD-18-1]|nr:hypothetical protein [Mycobacterium sp. CnD-18-1]MCG7607145.1 hypothetical protein [Mycobacterium sp. CnD-18-1]